MKQFNSKKEELNTKISHYYIDLIDYKLVAGEGFEPSTFGLSERKHSITHNIH